MAKKQEPAAAPSAQPDLTPAHEYRETTTSSAPEPAATKEPTRADARFRPKPGTRHHLVVAEDGTVTLTPAQAHAWKDLFDPV